MFVFFMQVLIKRHICIGNGDLQMHKQKKWRKKPSCCFKGHVINNMYEVILACLFVCFDFCWERKLVSFALDVDTSIFKYRETLIHTVHQVLSKSILCLFSCWCCFCLYSASRCNGARTLNTFFKADEGKDRTKLPKLVFYVRWFSD